MRELCEITSEIKISEAIVDLAEGGKRKDMYIEGVTLQSEVRNKNGRVYPKSVLGEAISKHVADFMKYGRAVGELNHPTEKSSEINPDRISHRFTEVREDNNNFVTKALVLNTNHGKQVKNLIEGGVQLGISSRGFGDVKESGNTKVVQSLYLVSLGDIVTNPSAPHAFVNAVFESAEWIWYNGVLVGKDLSEEIDEYKEALEKSSQEDRDAVAINLFKKYFAEISSNAKLHEKEEMAIEVAVRDAKRAIALLKDESIKHKQDGTNYYIFKNEDDFFAAEDAFKRGKIEVIEFRNYPK
jgi:hypothetical protein